MRRDRHNSKLNDSKLRVCMQSTSVCQHVNWLRPRHATYPKPELAGQPMPWAALIALG